MWTDLQETFYLIFAPFIVGLILPLFVAAGVILAVLMSVERFWRPIARVKAIWGSSNDTD